MEKRSLEHARMQLEDLSRQMHDEVSKCLNRECMSRFVSKYDCIKSALDWTVQKNVQNIATKSLLNQVSETENIRKNLAIERMIVEGCDILLDVNQMFIRQGTLVQTIHRRDSHGLGGSNLK